ncbi:uncharacterized protein BO88DRAFT_29617 [Aspergillus vadensis CBS 113365]|uniref:Uncharacterized protein n=1 Tax=Aspergillus vadensis (strain CBS 113365 / IMI 142717 / IBT 24658) TaxID=1448311 RepID=A0A319BR86_ASPVC|nr:hypothetical protein BO88DRAFT_29617 [Aspergillus vadensis CBS 113365]PYH75004.1 hypothetical protein BO88DRAFT_29617 [Aspergillus vadensis CBS 113365]
MEDLDLDKGTRLLCNTSIASCSIGVNKPGLKRHSFAFVSNIMDQKETSADGHDSCPVLSMVHSCTTRSILEDELKVGACAPSSMGGLNMKLIQAKGLQLSHVSVAVTASCGFDDSTNARGPLGQCILSGSACLAGILLCLDLSECTQLNPQTRPHIRLNNIVCSCAEISLQVLHILLALLVCWRSRLRSENCLNGTFSAPSVCPAFLGMQLANFPSLVSNPNDRDQVRQMLSTSETCIRYTGVDQHPKAAR